MKTANNICERCGNAPGEIEAEDQRGNTLWVCEDCSDTLAAQTHEREGDRQYERDNK